MSHYFAFVALIAVLVLIPGPAVILVMQKAVTTGYRGALRVAAGVLAADLVWAAAAAAGVSAVIVASEPAFLVLRFAGAAYLIYLGARLLLAPKDKLLPAAPAGGEDDTPALAGRPRAFRQGFLCEITNPKTLLAFTSVMPQFIPAGSSPLLPALLGVTFAALGFASLTLYSLVLARPAACCGGRGWRAALCAGPAASWSASGSLSPPSANGRVRLHISRDRLSSDRPACDDTLPGAGSFCCHDDGTDRTHRAMAGQAHGRPRFQDLLVPRGARRRLRRPRPPALVERAGRAWPVPRRW